MKHQPEDPAGSILLYPNPAGDKVSLQMELPEEELVRIDLFNVAGSLVQTIQPQQAVRKGYYQVNGDISGLAVGMYWVVVQSGEKLIVKPLVITRRN
ncbi:MAG: T9SS type A sorting domain-containing protein [Saprospiraceae bacterium]|nr:T9SS type A sorting domain-containing protein [Lewinella sp.]